MSMSCIHTQFGTVHLHWRPACPRSNAHGRPKATGAINRTPTAAATPARRCRWVGANRGVATVDPAPPPTPNTPFSCFPHQHSLQRLIAPHPRSEQRGGNGPGWPETPRRPGQAPRAAPERPCHPLPRCRGWCCYWSSWFGCPRPWPRKRCAGARTSPIVCWVAAGGAHSCAIDSAAAARSTPSPPATSHVDLPPPPPAVETTALLSAKAAASQAQPPCPTCGFGFEGYGNNCRFCAQCGQCQPMGNRR